MRVPRLFCLCCVLVLAGVLAGSYSARAAEEKPLAVTDEKLKEMPFLNGEVWKTMTHGEKVSFIWGIGHMVTVETDIMAKRAEMKSSGFATKMAEGLSGTPMNDIVAKIDAFYADNPGSMPESVMRVLWDSVVKPRIKAGLVEEPKE